MLILYNPPSSSTRKPVLPMSLLALGARLEGVIDYVIVDGNLERDPLESICRLVKEKGADLLAITVMPGPQLNESVPFCRAFRARHPEVKIIWGGYFPTQHFDACLASGLTDYVVRGYGEDPFLELVTALGKGGDAASIPSLAWRDPASGEIRSTPMAKVPSPDDAPDYPYHKVEMEKYVRPSFMGKRTLSHHSSYGCPFHCAFCAVCSMVKGKWLAQSGERTARIAHTLVEKYGADSIEFYDNAFFIKEARVAEFAERIMPLGIHWWAEARIDVVMGYADRTWELMRDSGLKMVFMGAEAGSPEVLERMNKGGSANPDLTLAVAEKMKLYGIVPEFSFVLGNPPDPEVDVERTLAFIRKVKRINPRSEIILYVYTPVPEDGNLYTEAREQGFSFPETLDEWVAPPWRDFSQRRAIDVPWLKPSLLRKIRDFECVLNAYYPTVTDLRMQGLMGRLIKLAGAWRYRLGFYSYPLELKVMQKFLSYQRPETTGC